MLKPSATFDSLNGNKIRRRSLLRSQIVRNMAGVAPQRSQPKKSKQEAIQRSKAKSEDTSKSSENSIKG